ncbi:MAG: hypothetical protein RLZZ324_933 [Candidatus Parcubacteria bacterium]|jgi:LPXTG-site transpeptidase (sortase) family protein
MTHFHMRARGFGQGIVRVLKASVATLIVSDIVLLFAVSPHLGGGHSAMAREPAARTAVAAIGTRASAVVGVPVRLRIARIGVNAVIESVGIAADGSMAIPKVSRDTAWFSGGPRPGESGSAVIAGHVNWLYGAKVAFGNLKKLKKGDVLHVQDDTGVTRMFVVRETAIVGADDDATGVFVSNDGTAHLNLVTCGGIWDRLAKQYTKRLVVYADLNAE